MQHRHLDHEGYSLAAIDDVIARAAMVTVDHGCEQRG